MKNTLVDILFNPIAFSNINTLNSLPPIESNSLPPTVSSSVVTKPIESNSLPHIESQTIPSIISATKSNKSSNYLKNTINPNPKIQKINLFQLKHKEDTSSTMYSDVFDFLSKDNSTLPSISNNILSNTDIPYNLLKTNNTKQRKSMMVDISYGKFVKTNSNQPQYKPNHDQKIKIMNTFFGSVPVKSNYDKIYNSLNTIPSYAQGGMVDRPTIAMGGENGTEHIIPEAQLSKNQSDTMSTSKINDKFDEERQNSSGSAPSGGQGKSTIGTNSSAQNSIGILLNYSSTMGLPRFETD